MTIKQFFIFIRRYLDSKVVRKIGPYNSERVAEKAERGVMINLNCEDYYTTIETE